MKSTHQNTHTHTHPWARTLRRHRDRNRHRYCPRRNRTGRPCPPPSTHGPPPAPRRTRDPINYMKEAEAIAAAKAEKAAAGAKIAPLAVKAAALKKRLLQSPLKRQEALQKAAIKLEVAAKLCMGMPKKSKQPSKMMIKCVENEAAAAKADSWLKRLLLKLCIWQRRQLC
jgi:hypothetical protein